MSDIKCGDYVVATIKNGGTAQGVVTAIGDNYCILEGEIDTYVCYKYATVFNNLGYFERLVDRDVQFLQRLRKAVRKEEERRK